MTLHFTADQLQEMYGKPQSAQPNDVRNLCLDHPNWPNAIQPGPPAGFWTDPRVPFKVEKPHPPFSIAKRDGGDGHNAINLAGQNDFRFSEDYPYGMNTGTAKSERCDISLISHGSLDYCIYAANLHDALVSVDLVQGATGPNGQKCMRIGGDRVVIRGKADNTKGGNDLLLLFAKNAALMDFDGAGGHIHFGVPVHNVNQYEADLRTMYCYDVKHRYGSQQTIPQCFTVGCRIKEVFIDRYHATGGKTFLGIEIPVGWIWNGYDKPCTPGPGADPLPTVHVGKDATWNGTKPTARDCQGLCWTNPGCLKFE